METGDISNNKIPVDDNKYKQWFCDISEKGIGEKINSVKISPSPSPLGMRTKPGSPMFSKRNSRAGTKRKYKILNFL